MKDWQIEAMMGATDMKIWAEQNAPDPCEDKLIEASRELRKTLMHLEFAIGSISMAGDILRGTPMEDKVLSFEDELETTKGFVKDLYNKFRTGRRE